MNLGIKFCGGCQSKYDRGEVLEKIKKEFVSCNFEYVEKNKNYDILIVISGCQIKCASIKDYSYKKIIHIDNDNYLNAIRIIDENIK